MPSKEYVKFLKGLVDKGIHEDTIDYAMRGWASIHHWETPWQRAEGESWRDYLRASYHPTRLLVDLHYKSGADLTVVADSYVMQFVVKGDIHAAAAAVRLLVRDHQVDIVHLDMFCRALMRQLLEDLNVEFDDLKQYAVLADIPGDCKSRRL